MSVGNEVAASSLSAPLAMFQCTVAVYSGSGSVLAENKQN